MLVRGIVLSLLLVGVAHAQDPSLRYATMPDLATAQALSAAAWTATQCQPQIGPDGTTKTGCDPEQVSKWVYPVIGLTDGRYAIIVQSGSLSAGEHIVLPPSKTNPTGKTYDLTANQIASLATRPAMGTLLGDILSVATLNSRVTGPQLTAITNYANAHPAFKTKWQIVLGGPSDTYPGTNIWDVLNELQAAGILTAANVAAITAPNATAPVP